MAGFQLERLPNWSGETCVIVASGPSAVEVNLSAVRGLARALAINSSIQLCPWADALYACDGKWWDVSPEWRGFAELKITQDRKAAERYGLQCVELTGQHEMSFEPGRIGHGKNSGFQALNLAAQFGCRRVLLVGYDMRLDDGLHWHGAHPAGLNNPYPKLVGEWREYLDAAAPVLEARGIEVINCTPGSALAAYPTMTIEEAADGLVQV